MHQDYTKICRVCMSDGSRDIFHKPSLASDGSSTGASAVKTVSPLERLLEKMRYVTMMKIEENDDLPRMLCDLCIVQLNVAYNFKRQAVENDTKLRQYFIENGITSNQAIIMNEAPSLRSSFTTNNIPQQQTNEQFPIVPLIVKTEPSDVDAFSDVTTETNVEIHRNPFQSVASNTTTSSPEEVNRRANNSVYTNDRSQSSMVFVNSGYEFNSITPSSDIEFVQNLVSTNNRDNHQNGPRQISVPSIATNGKDSSNQQVSPKSPIQRQTSVPRQQVESEQSAKQPRISKVEREIRNLSINMLQASVLTNMPKEHRRALGKTTRVRPDGEKHTTLSTKKRNSLSSSLSSKIIRVSDSPTPKKRLAPSSTSNSSTVQLSTKKHYTNVGRVKSNNTTLRRDNDIRTERNPENMIVLNPFNKNTIKPTNRLKVGKKLDNNSSLKKKSQQKLLRPKIEPPLTNKKN